MSCVAEDPSVVKWLLDIGADIDRCRKNACLACLILKERTGKVNSVTKCLFSKFLLKSWMT